MAWYIDANVTLDLLECIQDANDNDTILCEHIDEVKELILDQEWKEFYD